MKQVKGHRKDFTAYNKVHPKANINENICMIFSPQATSERNLPLCAGPREACNVIRQRFWLPQIVYRMCKCPDRTICPTEFTDLSDKRTIAFNVRAQLKVWHLNKLFYFY